MKSEYSANQALRASAPKPASEYERLVAAGRERRERMTKIREDREAADRARVRRDWAWFAWGVVCVVLAMWAGSML